MGAEAGSELRPLAGSPLKSALTQTPDSWVGGVWERIASARRRVGRGAVPCEVGVEGGVRGGAAALLRNSSASQQPAA